MSDSVDAVGGDGDGSAGLLSAPEEESRQSIYAEISREMVRLYKQQFGRGPTKARTSFADRDCLICTLENSLTPAEQNMVKMGEHQRLRDIRMFFQHSSENEFVEIVERLTGRKVRAMVSGIDTERDVSSEIFYLEQTTA